MSDKAISCGFKYNSMAVLIVARDIAIMAAILSAVLSILIAQFINLAVRVNARDIVKERVNGINQDVTHRTIIACLL